MGLFKKIADFFGRVEVAQIDLGATNGLIRVFAPRRTLRSRKGGGRFPAGLGVTQLSFSHDTGACGYGEVSCGRWVRLIPQRMLHVLVCDMCLLRVEAPRNVRNGVHFLHEFLACFRRAGHLTQMY